MGTKIYPGTSHGTADMYKTGCRCDLCDEERLRCLADERLRRYWRRPETREEMAVVGLVPEPWIFGEGPDYE